MLYKNITPKDYVERNHCFSIYHNLKEHFYDNVVLYVRAWNQELDYSRFYSDEKFITIITSAEGHNYIPQDQEHPSCLGVFMHYYPKISGQFQFDHRKEYFQDIKKVWSLPLGVTDFFKGDHKIPILDRPINCSFVGQLDPYRRYDFYQSIGTYAEKIEDSVFHFYEGWNNGIGDKYSEIMSKTKIALVPCGTASLDTFRYYEATKCGCVIVTCPQNEYDFMKKYPHITIDNWDNISVLVNSLLSGKKHLVALSKQTYKFWENNLSPKAAANYIMEKLLNDTL